MCQDFGVQWKLYGMIWSPDVCCTCHPLHKEIVVVLLAGGAQHADDVGVVEVAHHTDLLPQSLHHLLLLGGRVAHVRHLEKRTIAREYRFRRMFSNKPLSNASHFAYVGL